MKFNKINLILILVVGICSLLVSCKNEEVVIIEEMQVDPLFGSWEITSIHWMTKDTTYSIEKAQPGLLMINDDRYSIMWTPIEEERTPFVELSKPTDDEMKAGFRSIVFNAGTYEKTDSTLTTEAMIAKVPGFEGGLQFYNYKIENNKMEMVMFDETYPDGTKPEWYGTYQTKFLLRKVD